MNPKVPSLVGFATKDAAERDSSVRLAFRINCKDNKFTEITPVIINSILDDFIYPEIFQRAKNGTTISNFKLEKAHIIMHNDEKRNEILLNEEVNFIGLIEYYFDYWWLQ